MPSRKISSPLCTSILTNIEANAFSSSLGSVTIFPVIFFAMSVASVMFLYRFENPVTKISFTGKKKILVQMNFLIWINWYLCSSV